jgi:hypothetical protein
MTAPPGYLVLVDLDEGCVDAAAQLVTEHAANATEPNDRYFRGGVVRHIPCLTRLVT